MNNNTLTRSASILIIAATALISTILTCQFLKQLAIDSGASVPLFLAIAVVLDVTKNVAPSIALKVHKTSLSTALALSVFALALSAISVFASISALESGIAAAKKNTVEYAAYSKRIQITESEIDELRLLASTQRESSQITNAAKTTQQITKKSTELALLISEQSNLSPQNSILVNFGKSISITISVALELITVMLTCALHALSTPSVTAPSAPSASVPSAPSASAPSASAPSASVPSAPSASVPSAPSASAPSAPVPSAPVPSAPVPSAPSATAPQISHEVFVAKTDAQLYTAVKAAIIAGTIKPSYRGIQSAFSVTQDQIKSIQRAMCEEGLLIAWNNNGYKLA